MGQKAVQLRQEQPFPELSVFLDDLVGHPVICTPTEPPIFFFVTSEENVEKVKQKCGDKVTLTINDF